MIDKNNLGKIKHIYHIYTSEDKTVHCEKRSVVYINSKYAYYKSSRKDILLSVTVSELNDKFSSIDDASIVWHGGVSGWFLEVENFNSEEITAQVFSKHKESTIERAKRAVKRAQIEYLREKKKLDKLIGETTAD